MKELKKTYGKAAAFLKEAGMAGAGTGLILGTGMEPVAELIEVTGRVPFKDVPGLPKRSVGFHKGEVVSGTVGKTKVLCSQGRFHYYEGHSMRDAACLSYVMHLLGVKRLLVTSAVGGIGKDIDAGDVALVTDHLNLGGDNPLRGLRDGSGEMQFPNLLDCYDGELTKTLREAAKGAGVNMKEGVLAFLGGPAFETRAELRMLRQMDAHMVGWSLVPEVMLAKALGMDVAGACVISDISDPDRARHVELPEIVKVSRQAAEELAKVVNKAWGKA